MTDAVTSSPRARHDPNRAVRKAVLLIGSACVVSLLVLGYLSPFALISTAFDALPVCVLLAPPILLGTALMPVLGFAALAMRWRLLFGAALGLGMTSILVLVLGSFGCLDRGFWVAIVFVETAVGIALQRRHLRMRDDNINHAHRQDDISGAGRARYLWLFILPFVVLALLAAANAPGLIWSEEGFGYDVLEYHLQLPKEYRENWRIGYLPHNVYGNFPAAVEMLYLLNMVLQDGDIDTGSSANLVHLVLGAFGVFGAWVVGSHWSPICGVVAGVTLAATGWLTYLSGLAYVEHGLLFFGIAATGAVVLILPTNRGQEPWVANPLHRRLLLIAGLFAGFACGCKYTAVPMIAVPLALIVISCGAHAAWTCVAGVIVFFVGALIAVAPWLVKNTAYTGNPVFPLANSYFEAAPEGWGPDETENWDRGHAPPKHERSLAARVRALWRHVVADKTQRFGPAVLILAIAGLLFRRLNRVDAALAVFLIIQIVVWLFATHLYARFAFVFLIPLALLAGRSLYRGTRRRAAIVCGLLMIGAGWNFIFSARLVRREGAFGAPASFIYDGQLSSYEYFKTINEELADDAKVLLVGEARAFYFRREVDYYTVFNRNPFVETVRGASSDESIVPWLRAQGYTHVLVNWVEVERLRASYGFAGEIHFDLFERLGRHRLFPLRHFHRPDGAGLHVSIYRVSPA